MSQYVAEKYRAAQECIRALANKSGYGHFISDAMIAEWSTDLIASLAIVDAKYNPQPAAQGEASAATDQDPNTAPADDTGVRT